MWTEGPCESGGDAPGTGSPTRKSRAVPGSQAAGGRPVPPAGQAPGGSSDGPPPPGAPTPEDRTTRAHAYLPALVKWAHMGEPSARAEPGGHDDSGAVGSEHLGARETGKVGLQPAARGGPAHVPVTSTWEQTHTQLRIKTRETDPT